LVPFSPFDQAFAKYSARLYNHAILQALTSGELHLQMPLILNRRERIDGAERSLDFMGVNYYSRIHVGAQLGGRWVQAVYRDVHGRGLTDLGWEYLPEAFTVLLGEVRRYGLPVWITENGIADASGARRPQFIHDHLLALKAAMNAGLEVRGYLHWSLLDNFEWLEGMGPRFGLYRVDLDTLARTPSAGVTYLRRVAETGRILPVREALEGAGEQPRSAG
ncbi:MAG: family 1 glycosylhydrolase, partial [Myxococcales bacterium]